MKAKIKFQSNEEYKSNSLRGLVSFGNKKLPNTTAIFNLTPAHGCPSAALGLCEFRKNCTTQYATGKNLCYALKAEKVYPDCLPYRVRQKNYFNSVTAEKFADDFLGIYERKHIKPVFFRFNESGDFSSQADYKKAFKIAAIIQQKTGIVFYCYTHRTDLHFYNSFTHGLKVLKSGLMACDTLSLKFVGVNPDEFNQRKNEEESKRFNSALLPQDYSYFCPADCKKCNLCATVQSGTIYAKIH